MSKRTSANTTTARPRDLAALVPITLVLACGDAGNGSATGAAGTLDGPDMIVNAVTEELFTVGSVAGDGWDIFGNVGSVHFDAESNLHILDNQSDRIFVVGPDGSLVRTVGGPGEGPGEFNGVTRFFVARDGSYTVFGNGDRRIDLLEPGGSFVRRIDLDPATTGMVLTEAVFPDGSLLVSQLVRFDWDNVAAGFVLPEEEGRPLWILPFPLDGNPETLYHAWELPETEVVSGESSPGEIVLYAGRAFEPPLDLDVLNDGRVALIDSTGYRVKLLGRGGEVTGTIERPIAPLAVDEAIREAERERYRERYPEASPDGPTARMGVRREGAESLTFADEVPVLAGIKVDWEDRVWVERTGPTGAGDDGPIDIVTPAGGYIGTLPPDGLRTPDALGPGGLMAYIERADLDVPTVRVVRLIALEPQRSSVACGGAPPLGRASEEPPGERSYEGPARDSLAAIIGSMRAGKEPARLAEAVATAARIPPGDLGDELRDAMTRGLALSIMVGPRWAEDSVLARVGPALEEALARAWSQAELAAVIGDIPSRTREVTARDLVAARLASRLGAGEASDDLRAAMAKALASIAASGEGDSTVKHLFRKEVAVAWGCQHSSEDLAGFIRSIASGIERPEQAAAVIVVEPFGVHWQRALGDPPAWADSTGIVTHPGLRSALAEALAYMNEVGSRRAREIERLEAIGDRAARDSLQALEYGSPDRWGGRFHIHEKLISAVRYLGDPAMLDVLVRALDARQWPYSGVGLTAFGEAAVPHLLAALDTAASGASASGHLRDLARIAERQELAPETREGVVAALHGVLARETLRRIGDSYGAVGAAIDLAFALGDSAALRRVRDFAADPAEMVRAGVSTRVANHLVLTMRSRIGWRPPPMAQAEIAAALRPLSAWPTASHLNAAQLASEIDPELLSGPLREAMIRALDHTRDHREWDPVRRLLEGSAWLATLGELRTAYDSVSALAAIRAIPAGEYGPEQLLAASVLSRGDAGEEMRHAAVAALEHLNEATVHAEPGLLQPPLGRLHVSIFSAVMAQLDDLDPRSVSALVRSGFGLYRCGKPIVYASPDNRQEDVVVARAILAAIAEPGAPARRVSAGLDDLAVLLMENNKLTRDIPEELVEEIAAVAGGYLDGTSVGAFAATGRVGSSWVARNAIFVAAVAGDPEQVALIERIATDPEAVAALGLTDPNDEKWIRAYARETLAARPILYPGDC